MSGYPQYLRGRSRALAVAATLSFSEEDDRVVADFLKGRITALAKTRVKRKRPLMHNPSGPDLIDSD